MYRSALLLLLGPFLLLAAAGAPVTIVGSANATAALRAAAPKLKAAGLEITLDDRHTTTTAIEQVAAGAADLAATTRAVSSTERAAYPSKQLAESVIGVQLLALVVARDVWAGGVRTLSRAQMRRVYEREITNWKELGGPDQAIKFFCPEPGAGVWELLAAWLYGEVRLAPLGTAFEQVNGSEPTRTLVEFANGGLSLVSPAWIDGKNVFALSLTEDDGTVQTATVAAAQARTYPLAREIALVSAERPSGPLRRVIDFMQSSQGREALRRTDLLPVNGAGGPP